MPREELKQIQALLIFTESVLSIFTCFLPIVADRHLLVT